MNLGGVFLPAEALVRFAIFAAALAALLAAEAIWPARRRNFPRRIRWPTNLLLTAANTALLRLAFPLLAVGTALWAEAAGFGLFHWTGTPPWAAFAASLVVLDVIIYGQHVAMHRFAVLWRLHRVHHTDRDVDVTTAIRFHPGEIALSMGIKMGFVALLGAPAASVVVFEAILNGVAMFNHANLKLPAGLEHMLRWIVVTPEMHRIHHSLVRAETDTNYGFNLSLWDRLFGTYRARAAKPDFTLGLEHFQTAAPNGWWFVFALPFLGGPTR